MSESGDNAAKTLLHVPRVLIIEDTIDFADIIRKSLEAIKILTFVETSGQSGLETLLRVRPDIVLLDIGLPDMNGWRVLDAVKEARGEDYRPRIVVITAFGDPTNRLMGKLQEVDRYLVKPFTPREVQELVRNMLQLPE